MQPSKKEVTAVSEALMAENDRLIKRVGDLEAELRKTQKEETLWMKAWKDFKWWYGTSLQDHVLTGSRWVVGVLVGYYVIASIGMEFLPGITEPVTDVIKRIVTSLLPW